MAEEPLYSENGCSVLLVGSDRELLENTAAALDACGYRAKCYFDGLEALTVLENERYDFIVCDEELPRIDVEAFIRSCKKSSSETFLIVLTANGDEEWILSGILGGVYEYLSKPPSFDELLLLLRKIESREFATGVTVGDVRDFGVSGIVAKSPAMLQIFETVRRLANFNTTVLIRGESGTGKELLARAIHDNSVRRSKPFVAINCGAIPENLIESELFGHIRGAFTDATRDKVGLFEEANGGTVFLDEIGEMPLQLQVKILRVLQEHQIQAVGDTRVRSIDVRVIAATLRNLEDDVAVGRFREDLFYRLNVVSLEIPPLRKRVEDIEVLARHFIKKHNRRLGLNIRRIKQDVLEALKSYYWRGNVRELENCIEHAMVLSESGEIDLESLPDTVKNTESKGNSFFKFLASGNLSIKQCSRELEKQLIISALKKTKGNRTHAAKVLEISHRALLYKLKEYGLEKIGK